MKSVRLLIFDLDGTLVNSLEDITASVNFTMTRLGRPPIPLEQVRQFVGDGITLLLTRALGGRAELLEDAQGIYTVHHSRNLAVRSRLYPGVRETLEHFRALPMAVVTNKGRAFSEPLLEQLGIRRYFTMIVAADDGVPLKPAPDALIRIMEHHSIDKRLSAMVGDGIQDIEAGKAAGITTCAVTYGFRSEEALRRAGPDHLIHTFPELRTLFALP
jgi:phosphoglycolate phosphatase